jgi:hypothetical protein
VTADLEAMVARARAAKELADKATPGPWAWRDDDPRDMSMADALAAISLSPVEHVIWCRNNLPYEGRIASTIGACGLRTEVDAQANKDFIAAARTGWPETADDVETLAEELREASRVCDQCGCTAAVIRKSSGSRVCAAGHRSRWYDAEDFERVRGERDHFETAYALSSGERDEAQAERATLAERLAVVERERDDLRALRHASIGECCDTWNVARVHHVDCPMMALNTRQIAEQSRDRAIAERDALAAEVERLRADPAVWQMAAITEQRDTAIANHVTSRREVHDLRGQLQKLTLKLDLAEAKQAVAEGERDRMIEEVRDQAKVLESKLTSTPFPPPGISRSNAAAIAAHLRAIADRGGREPT